MICKICLCDRPAEMFRHQRRSCRPCEARQKVALRKGVVSGEIDTDDWDEKTKPDGVFTPVEPRETSEPTSPPHSRFADLVRLSKTRPTFEELCDRLSMPPGRVRSLVKDAVEAGVMLDVDHGVIGLQRPTETAAPTEARGVIAQVVGEHTVGVISDTHLGSIYCQRDKLKDFIHRAYDQGVREFLHPGDWTEGCYRHAEYEVSHVGITEQTRDLFEVLPQLPGLTYHGIEGNHDWTFTERNGVNFGQYVESYFRQRGRDDINFYGARGAYLKLRGALFHLWHPKGGGSYAKSYNLQKKVESYAPGEKPDILLTGHYHFYCALEERGVHAIACPTFQSGINPFGKSLSSGGVALGGLVLRYGVTEHGTLRNFSCTRTSYFMNEQPRRVETGT